MAEKLVIEIYKNKNPEELTKLLADPASKLETGSASALTASLAAALMTRAAAAAEQTVQGNERLDYIARNAELLRAYMVHLIDEDVKSRGPLNKAMKDGGEREIEAARHPAISICGEIVNMMGKCLELGSELADICPESAAHYIAESGELAMGAIKSAMRYIVDLSSKSSDETFRFVSRRENEMTLQECQRVFGEIIDKTAR